MQILRRRLLCMLAAALVVAPLAGPAAASDAKTHSVVIHVDANDADVMNAALNNATNIVKSYAEKGEAVNVEILANGPGLHMYREDTSPVKGRLLSFAARMPQVSFTACNNSKEAMESAEGKEIKLNPRAKLVPSGAVRLMELQEKGWSYIKP